jgi:hypothetical protein
MVPYAPLPPEYRSLRIKKTSETASRRRMFLSIAHVNVTSSIGFSMFTGMATPWWQSAVKIAMLYDLAIKM